MKKKSRKNSCSFATLWEILSRNVVEKYSKFVRKSNETNGKAPYKRETEWRVGALWSCLVWLMWLCLVCCVVSKSTRAWTPPSPWHAHWLAMIISLASPPLVPSNWGTYSRYTSILIVPSPKNPKSWMSFSIRLKQYNNHKNFF